MASRAVVEAKIARPVREWWRRRSASEVLDTVSLPQALMEVGILSMAHLAKRLTNESTPVKTKDQIALAMGPRMIVELKGRLNGGGKGNSGSEASELLAAYEVKVES